MSVFAPEFSEVMALSLSVVVTHMGFYYFFSKWVKDASIVDIAWGLGFVLVAVVNLMNLEEVGVGQTLITILVSLWGLRLAGHIYLRKIGKPEDWRYRNWRKKWGNTYWWRSLLQIFTLQGLIMLVIAAPVYVTSINNLHELGLLSYFGVAIWMIGFFFEAVGDYQLTSFINNPKNKGKIMQYGLWRYTRHPNYFGEISMWWGLFIFVLPLEYGWFAIVSPLMISFMLLKVSGITMLEKKYDDNQEFQEYKQRTSSLIPLPPRS